MLDTLNKYYQEGWLRKEVHTTLPLTIWNYSATTQYKGKWDEVTLQCRGLITDNNTGKAVVRPFKKFFNYEELAGNNSKKGKIPSKSDYVYVQEKMDGSLGILFNYKGEWVMATRGSFTSDQSIKGLEIVKSKYDLTSWMPEYAYLMEIIYPENRIVVDYKKEKIVFLSAVLNETYKWDPTNNTELNWTTANMIFKANGVEKSDIVKVQQHFNFSDKLYKTLKNKNEKNKEGYVLRFFPENFRIKIKFEDYIRLHKIMTEVSTKSIWETLSNGDSMEDLLKDIPDEFYTKIKKYENELVTDFNKIKHKYDSLFSLMPKDDRKEFALRAKKVKYPSILFAMLDGQDPSPIIWKILQPEFKKL